MYKKVLVIVFSLAIFIFLLTDVTRAYLTTLSVQKNNLFFRGSLTASIYENGSLAPDGTKNLTPTGNMASKLVQVKNMANPREINAYIRVMLVPTFRSSSSTFGGNMTLDPSGNTITIVAPNGGTVTLNLISGWGNNWIYSNGYYYYKKIVHPNELTAALLLNVTVSNSALWNTFQLEVLSDAIQAESGAAASAWGSTIAGQLEQP
jgi:hypothetical protein